MVKSNEAGAPNLETIMRSQPPALKKKISEVMYRILGDWEASDWLSGTKESRREATHRMISNAVRRGATREQLRQRGAGLCLLTMCLQTFIKDSSEFIDSTETKDKMVQ